ncbi:hypothetical protein MM214_18560 [Belliella kenyensis]|nr:hypothetical protein [Belliella kenyensis]
MYMSDLGRWCVVDPVADIYLGFSPYNFTLNNPIKYIDPNGMWVEGANGYSTNDPDEMRDFLRQLEQQQQRRKQKEKIYEGGTLDEFTVSAPRSFDGVLGRAADKWMADGKNYSTFGNIGFNTNNISTTSISLFEGSGFYLNGITPVGGIAMELEKVRYTGDNGKKTSDWFFTVRTGWGLDVGMGGMVTKYNTQSSVLRNGNIEGASAHLSILNYQNTQSLNFSWQDGLQIGQTTGHSMSIGVSPTFPVKLSGSVGVGYTFNISNLRR